ncbi:MAG: extracellular solute-binding protein [Caldilineaceae bacterium]
MSLFILAIAHLISACQSVRVPNWQRLSEFWPGDSNTPPPAIEIQLIAWEIDAVASQQLFMLIDTFNAQRTDIHAELQLVSNYSDALNRSLLDDAAPDLFLVDSFQLPTLVQSQQIQPISAYAGDNGQSLQLDAFYPALIGAFTVNQTIYCLPSEFNTLALLYNKTLFDQAEIGYPTDKWAWADLRTAALTISDLPTTFFDVSGMAITPDVARWAPFLYQAGGSVTDVTGARMTLDTPAALDAMNFYLNLVLDGAAVEPQKISSAWSGEAFGKGRVGMIIEGNWVVPYLAQEFPDLDYGVAPLPAGTAGSATVAFSWCYAVSKNTPHPNAAFELALYLTSQDAMQILSQGRSPIPARIALQSAWLQQHPGLEPFMAGIAYAHPWRFGPNFQDVIVAVNTGMQQVLDAEVSPDEVLRVAEVVGNEVLSR